MVIKAKMQIKTALLEAIEGLQQMAGCMQVTGLYV